jgi:hypothetical protein
MWLPPNVTSIYQPLDQGIIQNWKSYVKKQFVIFMASEENAYGNVELLKLLRKQDKEINARLQGSHKQARLDRWFVKEN